MYKQTYHGVTAQELEWLRANAHNHTVREIIAHIPISRATLHRLLKKYNLTHARSRSSFKNT